MKFCKYCGNELEENAVACMKCGKFTDNQVEKKVAAGTSKSKVVAGLLMLLLGAWGVGNFYLGQIGRGIAKIAISFVVLILMISSLVIFFEETDTYNYCEKFSSYNYYSSYYYKDAPSYCDDYEDQPLIFNVPYVIGFTFSMGLGIWNLIEAIFIFTGKTDKTAKGVMLS